MRVLALLFMAVHAVAWPAAGQSVQTEASHAVIMDHSSGEILWGKNENELMIPASMTKMMTAHLAFERLRAGEITLTDQFTTSQNAWEKGGWASGGSTMGLAIGDRPTVEELLRGIIVLSGNDACIVLAEGLSGSEELFAAEMTAMAQRMGLETANFRNSTGLDEPGHRISAADLARLARRTIMDFPDFYPLYAEQSYEWRGISQPNRNPLLGTMDGVDGLKTGHLEVSGFALTASAERNGERRIVVINGMESREARAQEAERLMRLAFTAFETRSIAPGDITLPRLPVWMGTERDVAITFEAPVRISGLRRAFAEGRAEIVYDGPLEAPVREGDPVASLVFSLPDQEETRVPLIATETVEREGFIGRALEGLRLKLTGGA